MSAGRGSKPPPIDPNEPFEKVPLLLYEPEWLENLPAPQPGYVPEWLQQNQPQQQSSASTRAPGVDPNAPLAAPPTPYVPEWMQQDQPQASSSPASVTGSRIPVHTTLVASRYPQVTGFSRARSDYSVRRATSTANPSASGVQQAIEIVPRTERVPFERASELIYDPNTAQHAELPPGFLQLPYKPRYTSSSSDAEYQGDTRRIARQEIEERAGYLDELLIRETSARASSVHLWHSVQNNTSPQLQQWHRYLQLQFSRVRNWHAYSPKLVRGLIRQMLSKDGHGTDEQQAAIVMRMNLRMENLAAPPMRFVQQVLENIISDVECSLHALEVFKHNVMRYRRMLNLPDLPE